MYQLVKFIILRITVFSVNLSSTGFIIVARTSVDYKRISVTIVTSGVTFSLERHSTTLYVNV